MKRILHNHWHDYLSDEFSKDYYKKLKVFLVNEYKSNVVFPDMYSIFEALQQTDYNDVKVVILGQDPYHGAGQAHGLCFSVQKGTKIPPSLQNIYKELENDLGITSPNHGYLLPWTHEGVLLLNTVLTVRQGEAASHRGKGWEQFTDKVISVINDKNTPVVFIFWGNHAQSKIPLITNPKHFIIKSPHPSPLSASRGFFGTRPFSKTNEYLKSVGVKGINWSIKD